MLDLKLYKQWINCLFAILTFRPIHLFYQGTTSPHDHPPHPPTQFFLQKPLHSSAISKHICANIRVWCIDLQSVLKWDSLSNLADFAKHRSANQT